MQDDDGAGLVLPVGDGHAVVIAADGVSLDGLGTVRADLAPGALAAVAAAAGLVAEGVTLPARLGGRLVELDAQSAALLKAARQATEPGGWVQGNLRQTNGEFAHVAPRAVLLGGSLVGARCLIGAGAVVLPERRVGDDAIVGAGSIVIADVGEGETVVGAPARARARIGDGGDRRDRQQADG